MSDIIEKTIASLPGIITGAAGLGTDKSVAVSRAFQNFVNSLGTIRSKYDEEQFIKKEISLQKQRLSQPNLSPGQIRESLVRLVYCHILGYDVSFAYIHAVKLAQQGTLLGKRAGYLVSSLFLREDNELIMLLVNTIQKDLKSTNMLTVCMALTAASQLISTEMIPALLPLVEERLKHPKEIVRKKAVLCMHSFHRKAPDLLHHVHHHFRAALCDPDPGVMWASLHVFNDLVEIDKSSHKDLIRNFIEIEDQILNRKLPMDYEFHSVPAPWLQIQILKLLKKLGEGDPEASQHMYPVLKEVLQRTDPSHKIGLAVIYECLETILSIWPQPAMVEHAANCVAKFLSSKNINLRYLGLKALSFVVKINSGYALEHQEIVIDCLEHPDATIQRKTLELLHSMANPDNLQVICNHMLAHLHKDSADEYLKTDIISKVTRLTHKYGHDRKWHIDTVFKVLSLAGDEVPKDIVNNTAKVIIDGCENENSTTELRTYAVQLSWKILKQRSWPNIILQLVTWILGEYGHLLREVNSREQVQELQSTCLLPKISSAAETWALSAMLKIGLREPDAVTGVSVCELQQKIGTENMEAVQRLVELESLQEKDVKAVGFPANDRVLEEADFTLSFLDEFVADAVEMGSNPYRNESMRNLQPVFSKEKHSLFTGLNFNPYEEPRIVSKPTSLDVTGNDGSNTGSVSSSGTRDTATGLHLKSSKKVWGREGIIEKEMKELKIKDCPVEDNNEGTMEGDSTLSTGAEDSTDRRRELASALFSGLMTPTQSAALTSSDITLGPMSPASSSGVSSSKSAASNPANQLSTENKLPTPTPREEIRSPGDPSTELLTAESLMSPSEGHWLSLHRDLASPERHQASDYLSVTDLESSTVAIREEGTVQPLDQTKRGLQMKACEESTDNASELSEAYDLHEADSLEDVRKHSQENLENQIRKTIVPSELEQYPCESNPTLVLESEQLRVWCQKVWEPESLKLVVKVESLRDSKDIRLTCCNSEDEAGAIEVTDVSAEGIAVVSLVARVSCLELQASSEEENAPTVTFKIPLADVDFLRPQEVSVDEFAQLWKEGGAERVTSEGRSMTDVVTDACQNLHLTTVQGTGSEALIVGKLLNSDTYVTGHAQQAGSSVTIRFRSSSDHLLQNLLSDFHGSEV